MLYRVHLALTGFELTTLLVTGPPDVTDSYGYFLNYSVFRELQLFTIEWYLDVADILVRHFAMSQLFICDLFTNVTGNTILNFFKEINLNNIL